MTNAKVLVMGDYFVDLIFVGLADLPELGTETYAADLRILPGGPFTTVAALHYLEVPTAWSTTMGTDIFSEAVLSSAKQLGISTKWISRIDAPTPSLSVSIPIGGDRTLISYSSESVRQVSDPRGLIEQVAPDILVLPGIRSSTNIDLVAESARSLGVSVFMDCQHAGLEVGIRGIERLLASCDVFAPNLSEALTLTGKKDIDAAVAELLAHANTVVVKLGSEGSLYSDPARTVTVPGDPVVDPVDTTGAGDAFNAGYVAAWLAGQPIEARLEMGNMMGRMAIGAVGSSAFFDTVFRSTPEGSGGATDPFGQSLSK